MTSMKTGSLVKRSISRRKTHTWSWWLWSK